MKKQSNIAKKKYQGLDKVHEFDKKDYSKTLTGKSKKQDLHFDIRFNFEKYRNKKKFYVCFLLQILTI